MISRFQQTWRCLGIKVLFLLALVGCQTDSANNSKAQEHVAATEQVLVNKKPNILWIYVEDISQDIGAYGNELVHTPTLDEIAEQGIRFDNTIMSAPVCSAQRSAMMTGVMQTTLGVHNHHSARTDDAAFFLPKHVKTIPELFKEAGYFTFNHGKDDYNFTYERKALYSGAYAEHPLYGKSGLKIDWNDRKDKSQPFFGQIQLKGGKHIFSKKFKEKVQFPIDRNKVTLPPYYPNDELVIEEWARYLESLQITDREVRAILERLERDGELENTLVFFFADHGMRFLRHKQFLYEGGIKVPFILYGKNQEHLVKPGVRKELITGFDIGATSLALAGIALPDYFEGSNILANDFNPAEFVISARDRCDFTIDRIRSVRTERFKYIRNFMPERSMMQPSYRDEWQLTQTMRELYENGKLNPVQSKLFASTRAEEELYDLEKDPHEINNLAANPAFQSVLMHHRNLLNKWIVSSGDLGEKPEHEPALKLMLGIWGDMTINPEFDVLRAKYPELSGSQYSLKNEKFKIVN